MEETGRETEDYYKIINELKDENRQLKTKVQIIVLFSKIENQAFLLKKTEQKLKNASNGDRRSRAGTNKSIIVNDGDKSRKTDENQQLKYILEK